MKQRARVHLGPDGLPAPSFPQLKGRLPPRLVRCPGCNRHLYPSASTCPHCGGGLAVLRRRHLRAVEKAQKAAATLRRLFERA